MNTFRIPALLSLVVLGGCVGTVSVQANDDSSRTITLEGDALQSELDTSPVRQVSAFSRIGAIWEGDRPAAIEISVSADGEAWSNWQPFEVGHIEMEETGLFIGQLGEDDGGDKRFYRLRRGVGEATYLRLEVLEELTTDAVEDQHDGSERGFAPDGDVGVNSRANWGARATRCTTRIATPFRITIHHTETPTNDTVSPEARLRGIQRYHMNVRGWCDVGYHYLMSQDGRVWEGRPSNLNGAHTGGANRGNIGIAVIGSHGSAGLNAEQTDRLAHLVYELATKHGIAINRDTIKGHREHKATSCPGTALFNQLDDIVAIAESGGTADGTGDGGGGGEDADNNAVRVRGVLYAGSDTADRISGATITLGETSVTTSSTGYFEFASVPVGSFTLTATAAGYQSRSLTRMTASTETWASFGLSRAGNTTGTAILQGVIYEGASSQNRVGNASVRLSSGEQITADENGFYKFSNLAAGTVTITASAAGYDDASIERTLVDGETEWGSVKLGGTTPPSATEACFGGEDGSNNTCFAVVSADPYTYPSPTNANYREPIRWLDVEAIDLSVKIAPNFRLSEIAKRNKGRYQVVQPQAIAKLQQVRNAAGNALTINSGFRSPPYNASVGGATRSRHMYGDAFDIMPGAVGQNGLATICTNLGAGYVAKYASGHVHCDWRTINVDPTFYGQARAGDEHGHAWGAEDLVASIEVLGPALSVFASGFDETEGELLREWIAFDGDGREIARATGASFVPPLGSASVVVDVGGLRQLRYTVR